MDLIEGGKVNVFFYEQGMKQFDGKKIKQHRPKSGIINKRKKNFDGIIDAGVILK